MDEQAKRNHDIFVAVLATLILEAGLLGKGWMMGLAGLSYSKDLVVSFAQ